VNLNSQENGIILGDVLANQIMNKISKIDQEFQQLEDWIKSNPDSRELKRAIAVKLALQGWTYRAIASVLGVSKSFVSHHKKQFQLLGIKGLKLSYKGAKSYLSSEQKQQVISWLHQQDYWDLSELECYLIDQYDVVFKSSTSYYELLKEAKLSWQKAQGTNPRQDPEQVKKKNEEIKHILKKLYPELKAEKITVYALDEVHLLEGDLISHLWGKTNERLKIPISNQKNRQTYYGALDLVNSELIIEEYQQGNGESTVDFLKKLLQKNLGKRIVVFWDGATYHKGKIMQEFLEEVNGDLAPEEWKITCHLFAPYAPETNPIESIWLSLKQLLRRCYRFCKNFRIMRKLFTLLVEWKLFTFPNLKTYDAFSCLI
jgi:transposase